MVSCSARLASRGGVGIYTRYITQELLDIDQKNQYVLFYRSASNLGRFSNYENVFERVVWAPNKALWDQVAIPYACWREKIDVVFHPKFTVPLLAPCKAVMVLHGAGWFMPDISKYWGTLDLKYIRAVMPLYCQRASAVLSVSQLTSDTFNSVFDLPPGKVKTVYFGPGKHFKPIYDEMVLRGVRDKYALPERFIFTLSGYNRGQRKNISGILSAYELLHGTIPHRLVIGGKDCDRFREEYSIAAGGYGHDVLFPGWIAQEDLPAVYSLADLYLYPSHSEAFPIPVTEAMACGTPIITSNSNGLREIAGDAALLVDASDPAAIAEAIALLLTDTDLRNVLVARGLERSAHFSWEKCARETLAILEHVGKA